MSETKTRIVASDKTAIIRAIYSEISKEFKLYTYQSLSNDTKILMENYIAKTIPINTLETLKKNNSLKSWIHIVPKDVTTAPGHGSRLTIHINHYLDNYNSYPVYNSFYEEVFNCCDRYNKDTKRCHEIRKALEGFFRVVHDIESVKLLLPEYAEIISKVTIAARQSNLKLAKKRVDQLHEILGNDNVS